VIVLVPEGQLPPSGLKVIRPATVPPLLDTEDPFGMMTVVVVALVGVKVPADLLTVIVSAAPVLAAVSV
jgi:hypothetical protein